MTGFEVDFGDMEFVIVLLGRLGASPIVTLFGFGGGGGGIASDAGDIDLVFFWGDISLSLMSYCCCWWSCCCCWWLWMVLSWLLFVGRGGSGEFLSFKLVRP